MHSSILVGFFHLTIQHPPIHLCIYRPIISVIYQSDERWTREDLVEIWYWKKERRFSRIYKTPMLRTEKIFRKDFHELDILYCNSTILLLVSRPVTKPWEQKCFWKRLCPVAGAWITLRCHADCPLPPPLFRASSPLWSISPRIPSPSPPSMLKSFEAQMWADSGCSSSRCDSFMCHKRSIHIG